MPHLTISMLKETWSRFSSDNASVLAAGIAYTVVFAIAPLIIVAVGIAGGLLGVTNGGHGHHVVEDQLIAAIRSAAGPQTAALVRNMADTSFSSHQGSVLAQTIGWATFLVAASGLFLMLQNSLNVVWHVQPTRGGLWLTVRNRLASALMLLGVGVLLLGTVALDFVVAFLWDHVTALLPFPGANVLATIVNYAIDAAVISLMFTLMYKYLPDTAIAWPDVRVGAVATAVLFVIGEALLGVYLSHAGIANGYGAAGSLVVLMVWAYYSAMLFLVGAEFTRVYAERHGSRAGSATTPQAPRRDVAA